VREDVLAAVVTIFAAIDHCSADCVGTHVVKKAIRFGGAGTDQAGCTRVATFCAGVATGVQFRHDHGSVYMSADFQNELRFIGMDSSPAFVRQPEGRLLW
jgi:putative transposase